MKFDVNVAGLFLALICAVSGWIVWWWSKLKTDRKTAIEQATDAATKEYAAKRDFEHIRNNQLQISQGIVKGFKEIEEKLDYQDKELGEIKAWLIRNRND
ncbi:hypothetical protein [Halotia branconii]|uniref:Uncharacterized protein n=1 Tax=Halotia branconii CENA392 TaxID=1539056 RepID=A0AAJ6P9L7_9CYAN|nr:hypothetical protein [Halotia branconii]WGV25964.1 hypothetical protein QI031_00110 [Halotia branconii CENA392]